MSCAEEIQFLDSPHLHKKTGNPLPLRVSSFLKTYGDMKGTKVKHAHYKPAKLYDKGSKWFVSYSYLNPATGKFERFKVYEGLNSIKDKAEKREFANTLVQAVNFGLGQGYSPFEVREEFRVIRNWTLGEGLNFFKTKIPDMGIGKKAESGYKSFLKTFSAHFGKRLYEKLEEITKADCMLMLSDARRVKGWTNTTYNNARSFGRTVFSRLIEYGVCKENPFKGVKKLKETYSQYQPFTDEHFELIKSKAEPELLRFLTFMYHTGVRPNEARQLTYENILRERKVVYVPGVISKNKKDGYVPVSDLFLQMFQGSGVIFGKGVNYFSMKFTKLRKELKLPEGYTLYSTKHYKALHLASDGVNPYNIMNFFRHSSLEVTMKYLRSIGINVSREAADKGR